MGLTRSADFIGLLTAARRSSAFCCERQDSALAEVQIDPKNPADCVCGDVAAAGSALGDGVRLAGEGTQSFDGRRRYVEEAYRKTDCRIRFFNCR